MLRGNKKKCKIIHLRHNINNDEKPEFKLLDMMITTQVYYL
jgi:hypothetical protein